MNTKHLEQLMEELCKCGLCEQYHFDLDGNCPKCNAGIYWQTDDIQRNNNNLAKALINLAKGTREFANDQIILAERYENEAKQLQLKTIEMKLSEYYAEDENPFEDLIPICPAQFESDIVDELDFSRVKFNTSPTSSQVQIQSVGKKYAVKYDPLRCSRKWTALGPNGRLGDVNTHIEVINLIFKDLYGTLSGPTKTVDENGKPL